MKLKDKLALIAGAGRGIGRGIALKFAEESQGFHYQYCFDFGQGA